MSGYSFSLTPEQAEKLHKWIEEQDKELVAKQLETFTDPGIRMMIEKLQKPYAGACGGALTLSFTPTSLGLVTKAKYFGRELQLTDFDDW